jgi:hypothetical protein
MALRTPQVADQIIVVGQSWRPLLGVGAVALFAAAAAYLIITSPAPLSA